MLDQFEVADLPMQEVVTLPETTSLQRASAVLQQRNAELLLVTEPEGRAKGVLRADMVSELASLAPHGPLSRMSYLGLVEVPATTPLLDAVRVVSQSGIGALAVRHAGEIRLVSRDALLDFNAWQLLFRARARRLASRLPTARFH